MNEQKTTNMQIIDNIINNIINTRIDKLPTTTAHEARLRLFQPTRKPKKINEIITTPWGKVRVDGKLGQPHEDIMDSIFTVAERPANMQDGRIKLLVDPYKIKKIIGYTSWSTLHNLLDDIMTTLIEIKEPEHLWSMGHLIDNVDFAKKANGEYITKPNPFGGERKIWRVELGKTACQLIRYDILFFRNPKPIIDLKHGISQAVARIITSHKDVPNGGWRMDKLIRAVAGDDISDISMRNHRRELRKDKEKLAKQGIIIDGDRIKLIKTTENK